MSTVLSSYLHDWVDSGVVNCVLLFNFTTRSSVKEQMFPLGDMLSFRDRWGCLWNLYSSEVGSMSLTLVITKAELTEHAVQCRVKFAR